MGLMVSRTIRHHLRNILFSVLVIAFILHRILLWSTPSPEPTFLPGGIKEDPPDIWYIYQWIVTLYNGDNPYAVWVTEEATTKSISYFPLYILIGQIPMYLGFSTYTAWASAMRPLHLVAELGIGLILYKIALKRRRPALGILGAAMWFFNNITIKVWEIQQIDSIVIFFALWALYYSENRPNLAGFLLGCSISIKPISLLLVPLLMLIRTQMEKADQQTIGNQIKRTIFSLIFSALIPVVISIPFLVMDYQNYLIGIFSESASEPRYHIIATYSKIYYDIIKLLNLGNLFSEQMLIFIFIAPVILAIIWFYFAYWRHRFNSYLFTSFLFAIYLYIGPVVFIQYFVWPIPMILAAIISRENVTQNSSINRNTKLKIRKQLLERENRFWFVICVLILILAGVSRLYFMDVIKHSLIKTILYLISDLGIGVIIYNIAQEKKHPLLGILGLTFWLFNQATLFSFRLPDNIPIGLFFAVLAIYYLQDNPDEAKLFLGIAIGITPTMLIFTPLFLIGPGLRSKLLENKSEGNDTYIKLKQVIISFILILVIPIGVFPIFKPGYLTFFYSFLNKPPFFAVIVLICLLITFYIYRYELDRFAYATLVSILLFTFTADKHQIFPFFWFVFVILYAIGGDIVQNHSSKFNM